jgi:hypothetical protein
VYVDVDVPDFEKAPLSLSGVALAVAPGVPVAPAGALGDLVPVIPTTERSFARAERVSAFLRVHQGGKSAIAPVALAIRILDGTGAAVFEETATLAPDRFSAGGRAADVTFAPPLVRLAPGDYLLTFEATLGRTAGRRDVRFVVR